MKCAKCKHRTDSRHHQYYCLGRRGTQIKHRAASRAGSGAGRHTAASVLTFSCAASGPIASASFYEDRKPTQAVQS
ncbi:MAG TPA: hypothetical protein PKY60_15030 [Thermoflexales bacterium]|nr:hypothetical protein [Thermoflexales bacterium]